MKLLICWFKFEQGDSLVLKGRIVGLLTKSVKASDD